MPGAQPRSISISMASTVTNNAGVRYTRVSKAEIWQAVSPWGKGFITALVKATDAKPEYIVCGKRYWRP